jgi:RNA polymerase sigma-70 factor (ECF subfamily)
MAGSSSEPVIRAEATAVADPSALVRAAYEEHRAALFGFLVSSTRDGELAAELLQEAFIRLLRVSRAGAVPLDIRAWLFRVSGNLAVSAARRRLTFRRIAPWLTQPGSEPSPENDYLNRERTNHVKGQLDRMRPGDRVALLMAANGCTTSEIAHALGRSDVAARTLLCRARMRLRELVDTQDTQSGQEVDR